MRGDVEEKEDKDTELIKAALRQEIEAEKRYAKHLAYVNNKKVRKVLKALHKSEQKHKKRLVEEIKARIPKFNFKDDKLWEIEINLDMLNGIGDDIEIIKSIIEINIEKEKEALNQYHGYSEEAKSDELKQLFIRFNMEEDEHRRRLEALKEEIAD